MRRSCWRLRPCTSWDLFTGKRARELHVVIVAMLSVEPLGLRFLRLMPRGLPLSPFGRYLAISSASWLVLFLTCVISVFLHYHHHEHNHHHHQQHHHFYCLLLFWCCFWSPPRHGPGGDVKNISGGRLGASHLKQGASSMLWSLSGLLFLFLENSNRSIWLQDKVR